MRNPGYMRSAFIYALAAASAVVTTSLACAQSLESLSWAPASRFGTQANGPSAASAEAMSADGRRVVFSSTATNLVANDKTFGDIYVHDRDTQQLTRVVLQNGVVASGFGGVLSGDGRFVAFESTSQTLLPELPQTAERYVYVVALADGAAHRIRAEAVTCGPLLSHDGSIVIVRGANQYGCTGRGYWYALASGALAAIPDPPGEVPEEIFAYGTHSLSADGRFVAYNVFRSVVHPALPKSQVYIYDRDAAEHVVASVMPDGAPADAYSVQAHLSADGRKVVFASDATTLVAGDTNGKPDVFLRDLDANTTTRVSVAADGTQGNDLSYNPTITGDGETVFFTSLANTLVTPTLGFYYAWRAGDLARAPIEVALPPNAATTTRAIRSHDASIFGLVSSAALVSDDTNFLDDVYVRLADQTHVRLSVSTTGAHPSTGSASRPFVSSDGSTVYFFGSNFFASSGTYSPLLVHARGTGATSYYGGTLRPIVQAISPDTSLVVSAYEYPFTGVIDFDPPPPNPSLPPHVLFLTMPGMTQPAPAIAATGNAQPADGVAKSGTVSADGNVIAFLANATNLTVGVVPATPFQLYARALDGTQNELVSQYAGTPADAESARPALSAGGRYVVFDTPATNLVPGDANAAADVFLLDRTSGAFERVSIAADGGHANGASTHAQVSRDGRSVVFVSTASNLVDNDLNGAFADVFVRDRVAGVTRLVSIAAEGTPSNAASANPQLTPDGHFVTFDSTAISLLPEAANGKRQVYLADLEHPGLKLVSADARGVAGDGDSSNARPAATAEVVTFQSAANNWVLDRGIEGAGSDVFVKQLVPEGLFADGFD